MRARRRRRGSKAGTVLIIIGLLLTAGAAGLTIYNILDAKRAEKESAAIVQKLDEEIPDEVTAPPDELEKLIDKDKSPEMPTKMIDGYAYIGELHFPDLNLTLPVMAEWDYSRLRISPCRYSGSYKTDDLVICAHNYASHFSPVKWMDIGAEVDFTTVDGVLYKYHISGKETVQPTSVEQMIENSKNTEDSVNDWDLTLFTCNTGGQTREAVRCKLG